MSELKVASTLPKQKQESKLKSKMKWTWKEMKKHKVDYLFLAPFFSIFFVFVLIPVLSSVVLSFTDFNMLQTPEFVGFSNYERLFLDDDVFTIAIRNTILFAVITGPLGFVLSFVFAWLINELPPKLRAVLTFILYAPSLAGGAVFTIWKFIFAGDMYGLVNSVLMKLRIINEPIQWLTNTDYNFIAVVIVIIWLSMGAGFLSFVAGLQNLNHTYFEAAAIDGVRNRWQELWYITLPQMVPQLLFGAVMTISGSFAVGQQSIELTGMPSTDYSTHTILIHMLDYGTIRFEMGYASAIAVVLFIAMLVTWKVIENLFRGME